MDKSNIAEGYNVFTGDVDDGNTTNKQHGEIHTGDAWLTAGMVQAWVGEKRLKHDIFNNFFDVRS